MPIQSDGQSVSAWRGKRYTETGLLLSSFAFNFNLRRYGKAAAAETVLVLKFCANRLAAQSEYFAFEIAASLVERCMLTL
jgi:hypothetical protein